MALFESVEFWSRSTAASDCLKIYEREKLKLRQKLKEIPGRICLTTDLWRALTVEGYLCLTAHYIDSDWSLKSRILDFCAFPPPHTGGAIANFKEKHGWNFKIKACTYHFTRI